MRAVLFPGDREVVHTTFPDPEPGINQVVVAMKASGLCGSELHGLYQPSKEVKLKSPFNNVIPGHEPCGVVQAVGAGVVSVKPGDRVSIYHIGGCGYCDYCHMGWMINCVNDKHTYGWNAHGGHADLILVDERNCVRLPDELSFADGAHCACGGGTAYQALLRLDISGRDRLAVFGLGPVGLGAVALAKAMGATVYAVEVVPERIELGKVMGADVVIDASKDDPVAVIRDLTEGQGAEATADFSANPKARNQALDAARIWGRVAFVGEGHSTTIDPSPQMLHKQLTVIGSWVTGLSEMAELTRFMARHGVSFDKMVTHRFPLERMEEAVGIFDTGRTGKVMIEWS